MILLGIVLLVLAIVAYALGAQGVAGFTLQVGKWILIAGILLAVLFFLFGSGVLGRWPY